MEIDSNTTICSLFSNLPPQVFSNGIIPERIKKWNTNVAEVISRIPFAAIAGVIILVSCITRIQ
jgi:hypothetical protein